VALTKVGKEGITGISNSSNATAITIDSSENVGIGVSPTDILHVKDSASTNVIIDAPTDNASLTLQCGSSDSGAEGAFVQFIQNTTSKWQMGMNTNNSFRWYNYNTSSEAMQIDSSSNLLVGTQQVIFGSSGVGGVQIGVSFISIGKPDTGTNTHMSFNNGNGQVGAITTAGSSTSYGTSSDYRLKTTVTYDWDATTRLKQLKPARFKWIADGDDAVFVDGFLAHECGAVPEAITGEKDAMRDEEYEVKPAVLDDDGNEVTPAVMGTRSVPDYQSIDQSKLVPLLVKTIQELEARITALENA